MKSRLLITIIIRTKEESGQNKEGGKLEIELSAVGEFLFCKK
jgi:hypothetical protein